MSVRRLILDAGVTFSLSLSLVGAAHAQPASDTTLVPLTVDEGFPLRVILTDKLRCRENEPVRGKLIASVYAFDREVIPVGAEVLGRITDFREAGKWKRVLSILAADFTPPREPRITFDALVLPDGTRIPIETSVVAGADTRVKESGKDRVKRVLGGLAPYRPQSLPVGTRVDAILLRPLDFGVAVFRTEELEKIGSQPPAGSRVSALLVTPVDSRTSTPGAPVEARVTRPLFSSDHRLIVPVGSRLRGEVLDVSAARKWHRHGELAFRFTTMERPVSMATRALPVRKIEGYVVSVNGAGDRDDTRVNEEGETRISESRTRFIAPAYALLKADRAIHDSGDPFDRALAGAYGSKVTTQIAGRDPALGLAGSISGTMVPAVGIGLGLNGAARSIYSIIGRGQEIRLPVHTPMEIRLQ